MVYEIGDIDVIDILFSVQAIIRRPNLIDNVPEGFLKIAIYFSEKYPKYFPSITVYHFDND